MAASSPRTPSSPGPIRTALSGTTSRWASRCRRLHPKLQRSAPGELLNETLFTSLAQARVATALWRADYNTARPALPECLTDTGRVRQHLHPATVARAALCQRLRASARRFTRPAGQNHRRKRTQNWIELGGNVTNLRCRFTGELGEGQERTHCPTICAAAPRLQPETLHADRRLSGSPVHRHRPRSFGRP